MMLTFYKYQGTGNDFVMVDNRLNTFPKEDTKLVAFLCDRRFGIGADGLILLENDEQTDFKMVYYNADGNQSTMCGNGGRCLVAFANHLGVIASRTNFIAVDGLHEASIDNEIVSLQMQNVTTIDVKSKYAFLDTGSPHHVQLVEELSELNVDKEGAKLRYGIYGEVGSNINFVEQVNDTTFNVRTYERGVEGETLSCGTGVTAVALAMFNAEKVSVKDININTSGGALQVRFDKTNSGYENIVLVGSAKQVFKGVIEC